MNSPQGELVQANLVSLEELEPPTVQNFKVYTRATYPTLAQRPTPGPSVSE